MIVWLPLMFMPLLLLLRRHPRRQGSRVGVEPHHLAARAHLVRPFAHSLPIESSLSAVVLRPSWFRVTLQLSRSLCLRFSRLSCLTSSAVRLHVQVGCDGVVFAARPHDSPIAHGTASSIAIALSLTTFKCLAVSVPCSLRRLAQYL